MLKQSDLPAISLFRNPDIRVGLAQHYNTFLLENRTVDNIWLTKIHLKVLESHNFRTRNNFYIVEMTNTGAMWLASLNVS